MSNRKNRRKKRKRQRTEQKTTVKNDRFSAALLVVHEKAKAIEHPQKEELRVRIRELIAMYHNVSVQPTTPHTPALSIVASENLPPSNTVMVREVE